VSGLAEMPGDLYHRHTMRRLLPFLVLVLLAGGVAACDASFTPYAAKVNGTTISQGSVKDELNAIATNVSLRTFLQSSGAITGAGVSGTYSAAFEASRLSAAVVTQLVRGELARRHLSVSPIARTMATCELNGLLDQIQSQQCPILGPNPVGSFSPTLKSSIVDSQAAANALTASLGGHPLTDGGIASFSTANPVISASQCVSIIIVGTPATAQRLRTAITQGASFAAVAKASSLDTASAANGGAQGCGAVDGYPAPFNALIPTLSIGEVSPPQPYVSNGTTYALLLEVTARPSSQLAAANELVAKGGAAETALINGLLSHAKVDVNPVYGKWAKVNGVFTVTTNSGPPPQYLSNPSALTPSVHS
jgi:hypothetical protein